MTRRYPYLCFGTASGNVGVVDLSRPSSPAVAAAPKTRSAHTDRGEGRSLSVLYDEYDGGGVNALALRNGVLARERRSERARSNLYATSAGSRREEKKGKRKEGNVPVGERRSRRPSAALPHRHGHGTPRSFGNEKKEDRRKRKTPTARVSRERERAANPPLGEALSVSLRKVAELPCGDERTVVSGVALCDEARRCAVSSLDGVLRCFACDDTGGDASDDDASWREAWRVPVGHAFLRVSTDGPRFAILRQVFASGGDRCRG